MFDPSRDLIVVLLTNRQHPGHSVPYRSVGVWDRVLRRVLSVLPADEGPSAPDPGAGSSWRT
jgi:hypothetical protein